MFDRIQHIHFPNVQKVLPAVYGDELSYYELLAKFEDKINNLITLANELGVDVAWAVDAMKNIANLDEIDAQVQALQETADTIQATLNALPSYEQFDSLSQQVSLNTANKIPFPILPNAKYGIDGQVLRTNGDGTTQWQNPIEPTDAQAETYINAWLNAHPEATTTVQDGSITPSKLAQQTHDLMQGYSAYFNDIVTQFSDYTLYLYKTDTYINTNGEDTVISGYNTYKIPLNKSMVNFVWDGNEPWDGLSAGYVFTIESNGVRTKPTSTENTEYLLPNMTSQSTDKNAIFIGINIDYVYVTVKRESEDTLTVVFDSFYPKLNQENKSGVIIESQNSKPCTRGYINSGGNIALFASSANARTVWFRVKENDRVVFDSISGVTHAGYVRYDSTLFTDVAISTSLHSFTFESDGLCGFFTSDTSEFMFYPSDSIKIDSSNVIGLSNGYENKNCVAFGTSLTYRAQTTHGYLQYLPLLSGMTLQNEGIGSATIANQILASIKSFTDYTDFEVCLLEGFVNDWYQNTKPLGTYTDADETTVCGCLRSAINYIYSENANITLFVILDHYGRNHNSIDCSSNATRNGTTQYEYYNELEKVCNSLSVPVIPLYKVSEMNENTPQYFVDNIHPSALGAKQTANIIWSYIKNRPINEVL